MKFDINSLHSKVKTSVIKTLKEFNISLDKIGVCGNEGNFPFAQAVAYKIMKSAGISYEYCIYALNGIPANGCDNEMGENWNWCNMYDGAMLLHAIELANDYVNQVQYYEVGMKYPNFSADILKKKYKLNYITTIEPEFSKKQINEQYKTYYDVWQDAEKKYTFSFEKDRIGKGGYAGLVVKTMEDAVKFCKWYLSKKSFYIKDINLFKNGLGGLNINELKENNLL